MSYLNQAYDPRRRATAIATAGAVNALLAIGLVTGLSVEFREDIRERFIGTNIPLPQPTPEPSPTPTASTPPVTRIPPVPLPPLPLPPRPVPTYEPGDGTTLAGDDFPPYPP